MPERLDLDAIEAEVRRRNLPIGQPLRWSEQTASTNADAVRAANEGASHGTLFLADWQSAGRGRSGRTWLSPPGENLMMSLVLRPEIPAAQLASITLALGLGVADAVTTFVDPAAVGIKWPNDVHVRSKKIAGILVEGAVSSERCDHVVVGIGLNVSQTEFDPSIAALATSLALEAGSVPTRTEVLLSVLSSLSNRLTGFEEGGLSSMLDDLRARDVTKGRAIRFGSEEGVADGIDAAGRLRVLVGGEVKMLHAGDVKIVP